MAELAASSLSAEARRSAAAESIFSFVAPMRCATESAVPARSPAAESSRAPVEESDDDACDTVDARLSICGPRFWS